MPLRNFNNLALSSSHEIGRDGSSNRVGNTSPSKMLRTNRLAASQSTDWFSHLNEGAAHPITANGERFGNNPSIDEIVSAVLQDLGIQD